MHEPSTAPNDVWIAAHYARHSSLQEAMAQDALALVCLRGDERVLDIGCGDGRITARIATQLVPRGTVCGVDASPDMIAFAAREHAGVANLQFRVADARQLQSQGRFIEGPFDVAVSFNALHWVPDLWPALRALRAALLPRGRAWLRLVTQGPVRSLEAVAEQVRRKATWAPLFEGFADPYLRLSPEQVASLATQAGLDVLDVRTRLRSWDFGSRAAFAGFCSAGFGAWTRRLPVESRGPFVDAVLDCYLAGQEDAARSVFRFCFYQTDLAVVRADDNPHPDDPQELP